MVHIARERAKPGLSAIASSTMRTRCAAGGDRAVALERLQPGGHEQHPVQVQVLAVACARIRWPRWIGSNVPPRMPSRGPSITRPP